MPESAAPDLYLGIDPDMKNAALALVEATPQGQRLFRVETALAGNLAGMADSLLEIFTEWIAEGITLKGAAVEGQSMQRAQRAGVRLQTIADLSLVSGMCLGIVRGCFGINPTLVQAVTWKGSTPKRVNQARTWKTLGVPYEQLKTYAKPTVELPHARPLKKAALIDIGDAAGIALWRVTRG